MSWLNRLNTLFALHGGTGKGNEKCLLVCAWRWLVTAATVTTAIGLFIPRYCIYILLPMSIGGTTSM